jgi:MoxR-like ATPase
MNFYMNGENMSSLQLKYTGKKQPAIGERDPKNGRLLYAYLPSPELVEAVNLAIYLERPLLLQGDPGCGKTQVASAVAYELDLELKEWYVKSTSRAKDGLYTFDAIRRLRDAQLSAISGVDIEKSRSIDDLEQYIRFQQLGLAFRSSKPMVILIDEIDKADIDFPNDLLLEIDEKRFIIDEVDEHSEIREIKAKFSPLVLITSNGEKNLPDAFLRRCIFHNLQFPDRDRLIEIINARFANLGSEISSDVVALAVERFLELRQQMQDKGGNNKKVSTSELIDWVKVLQQYSKDEAIEKLNGKIPFTGVLLKSLDDHIRYLGSD